MSRFRPQTIGGMRGLNENENPHSLRPGDLSIADNTTRTDGLIGTRPGTQREPASAAFENRTTGSNPIQGLAEFRKNFDEGRVLIAVGTDGAGTPKDIFYQDAALLPLDGSAPLITAAQDNVWTFAMHNNLLFAAGGAEGDHIWTWDGATGTGAILRDLEDVPAGGADLQPKFIFQWRGYLFMNGLRGHTTFSDNPAVSRYMTFGTDPILPASWPEGNSIGFTSKRLSTASYGNDFTTGFGTYADNSGDWLMILSNKALYAVTLDPNTTPEFRITDTVKPGCVSQRAFVNLGLDSGDGIYISETGIHSLRQSQAHGSKADSFLSWNIRATFNTLNKSRLQYAVGVYDHIRGVVVFAVSTGANTAHDLLLVLDVKDQQEITAETAIWHKWKIESGNSGIQINDLLMARDSSDDWRLYFGTVEGDVGFFTDDTFSDLATSGTNSYPVHFRTRDDDYGTLLLNKKLGDVMVNLSPGGSYNPKIQFIFDYGQRMSAVKKLKMPAAASDVMGTTAGTSFTLGSSLMGGGDVVKDDKVYGSGSFRTLALDFSHEGNNEPFRVGKVDLQIAPTGESIGDK